MLWMQPMKRNFPGPIERIMPGGFQEALETAARACHQSAVGWRSELGKEDFRGLVRAFHRAESLAEFALMDAMEQVRPEHVAPLQRQREEEEKHVNVFADFLDGQVETPHRPKSRVRPEAVWYTLLLLNELTGFCQFSFLHALLPKEKQVILEDVMADEEEHVERLLRWMLPVWEGRGRTQAIRMLDRFSDDLPGRMEQFFEGEHLSELRQEMHGHVGGLLAELKSRFSL